MARCACGGHFHHDDLQQFARCRDAGRSREACEDDHHRLPNVLERLYLVDPVPGWLPTQNRLSRLTQAPKHHLADPALAAHLVGVDAGALLRGDGPAQLAVRDGSFLGALFKSLVTLSVRVYAQANEATVHHLRTRDGDHEVDLIVARRDDRVVAIEIKLRGAVDDADVRHLLWLREQLGDDLLDAAVITTGDHAYRRQDGSR